MPTCLAANGGVVHVTDARPTCLIVGTVDGVSHLEREGSGPWRETGHTLRGVHISSLLFEPTRGGVFAGVHGAGLYRSMDGGETWELKTHGLTIQHVWSLAVAVQDDVLTLFAGTEPAYVFRSTDYGETWEEFSSLRLVPGRELWNFPPPPHIAHARAFAFDPTDAKTMFVGVEQGALLKSTDAGDSWRELDGFVREDDIFFKDVHRVFVSPQDPARVYMVGGDGAYLSHDRGDTWERLDALKELSIGYPETLVVSPFDDHVMFVAGASGDPTHWQAEDVNFGFARSMDRGKTWESLLPRLPRPLDSTIEGMTMHVREDGFSLFAGTAKGEVFASDDEGEHWELVSADLAPITQSSHYRRFLPPNPGAEAPAVGTR